jgi:hypothetical protein
MEFDLLYGIPEDGPELLWQAAQTFEESGELAVTGKLFD